MYISFRKKIPVNIPIFKKNNIYFAKLKMRWVALFCSIASLFKVCHKSRFLDVHICFSIQSAAIEMMSWLNYEKKIWFHRIIYIYIFAFFRAAPKAYGGSQARGLIGATAASLCHNLSNARSEPHLQPTPQLRETPAP